MNEQYIKNHKNLSLENQPPFRPCVLWFTGLSGAGKSTTALALQMALNTHGYPSYLLDGDKLRQGLCKDLGFNAEDRKENIRRLTEVASLMVDAGLITLVAAITPFKSAREELRQRFTSGQFIEVYVDSPLSLCEIRDPKGLYRKARAGELHNFTGIDSPYEIPARPELHLHTDKQSTDDCVHDILTFLEIGGYTLPTKNLTTK